MKKYLTILFLITSNLFICQTVDVNGKKQGYWKKKDEKTKHLIYEGTFKDDKPIGKFIYYYPNDSVRAIMHFKPDGKTANAKLFHLTGKRMAEGKYVNQEIKDSIWTYYDEAGILISRERYSIGKKEGSAYVYFPDGTISEERNYKNDIQQGTFKQYFDAKKIRALATFVNGQMEGRVTYYFPSGVEAAAGYYKNGQKNGPWVYKEKNGKITDKELYNNGVLAGKNETEEFFSKNKLQENKSVPTPTVIPKNKKTSPKNK